MQPSHLCLDANVIIASLLRQEKFHQSATKIIDHVFQKNLLLFEPAVVVYEVVSALHRKSLEGEFNRESCDRLIHFLDQLPMMIQWQPGFAKEGAEIAFKFSLKKINDFCYLAVASARNIPLITLDKPFLNRARNEFKKVYSADEFANSLET